MFKRIQIKNKPTELEEEIYTQDETSSTPNKPYKKLFKISLLLALVCITGLILFSSKTISGSGGSSSWLSNFSIVGQIQNLGKGSEQKLKGEERGRVNILLLGIGGKNHDGGLLTDTIMILSLDTINKRVAMVSVPRDLTVPIEGYGWRKINSINAYAEMEKPGTGPLVTSQAIGKIFDQPIDYYMMVDFEGFAKVIDDFGGVDVTVDNTLDDYRYPVLGLEDGPYNSRWEHLHIDAGTQHMDGKLALKYARSRHGIGVEGSDFARAKRQQKIMEAVKGKLTLTNLLFKPTLVSKMINNYEEHVSTNLQVSEMMRLWGLFKNVQKDQIINKVLDNSATGMLVNRVGTDGAYILVPSSGNFTEIRYMIDNIFGEIPTELKTQVSGEKAVVAVKNGTWIAGLASKAATNLEELGISVTDITNASKKTYVDSIIYDLSNNQKPQTLAVLEKEMNATVSTEIPTWLTAELSKDESYTNNYQKPDFVLVLGKSFSTPKQKATSTIQ
jgi:polyisoprenyl-teichoic acid--peptidoglycan teichoic acid transferase